MTGLEAQNQCAEIKLRAERKAGEVLENGLAKRGRPSEKKSHDGTFLKDVGINKNQSSRWLRSAGGCWR